MRNKIDMCNGPILRNVIAYTVPIIFTGVLQLLFNAADLIVVGRFRGNLSVGAVGATSSIINLIINLFIGLSVGAGVTVAQALGAGNAKEVHRTVHTAIPAAVLSGVFLTAFGMIFAEKILQLVGTPDDIINLSAAYLKIYFGGVIFVMLYNFGAAILRAAGDTKSPLIFLTIAGVINVFLNLFFVCIMGMDVDGVALATAISQAVSAILVLIALMRRRDACRLKLTDLRIYIKPLKKMAAIGLPAGIQGSLFSVSNVIIQSSVNSFGALAVSGGSAAGSIEGFVYTAQNSFQQTAMNFAGQNLGAGNYKRVKRVLAVCLACATVTGVVLGVTVRVFGRQLLSIYIPDSQRAVEVGLIRLTFITLPYFICALQDTMTGVLRGIGVSIPPMIICIFGICVFRIIWICTVFKIFNTLECIYISYPISWSLTFIAQVITYLHVKKKRLDRRAEDPLEGTA